MAPGTSASAPLRSQPGKLRAWLKSLDLQSGGHAPDSTYCVMEAAAYVAGEPWSDAPKCVSTAITAFLVSWNDNLPDDQRDILKPLIPVVLDTRTGAADEKRRAWMATDWLARTFAPAWLDLAAEKSGSAAVATTLRGHAKALRALEELTADGVARAALPLIEAARKDVEAAWSAARSAAWSAAWSAAESAAESAAWSAAESAAESAAWSAARSAAESAARSAARSAAESAARSAAESAAWSAAWSAARSAARSAADEALAPTVKKLQVSAVDLVKRMAAVGR
jgi:hypothetical protein